MLIQILGYDDDKLGDEVMIGFLLKSNQLQSLPQPKFLVLDQFLVDKIHSQLENLQLMKHFKYQTVLFHIFIYTNQDDLQRQEPTLFALGFSISLENGNFSFFDFTNRLMSRVYELIFDTELPIVSQEMNNKIHVTSNHTRDWFLYKDHTIIRFDGFTTSPYVMTAFLTPRLFALEFMRQRLHSKKDHFVNVKKTCNIKVHFRIEPFVIKSNSYFPIIENLLESINFQTAQQIKYDPR